MRPAGGAAPAAAVLAQAPAASSDLALLRALTNVADINRLLHDTLAKERAVDQELEQLLGKRVQVEQGLLGLRGSTAELLEVVAADADGLAGSVRGTADLAERVSRKVRELDTAQSRIHATLARINIMVDRTAAINGVRAALEAEDYEAAARHVQAFLALEQRFGPIHDELDSKQAQEQRRVLEEAQARLQAVVRERLEEARGRRDHATILRFTRLFPLLGMPDEGLRWFVDYLRQLVTARAKENYSHLVESAGSGGADFATTLTELLRDVAVALDENEPFLREAFGPQAVLEAASGLQRACDEQGTRVLQRFVQLRRLPQLVKEVGSLSAAGRSADASAAMPPPVDPRQVEGYLEELLLLCQRSEEYAQFVLGAMAAAVAPAVLGAARENAFRSGPFSLLVRELGAYYINMEEFYLDENVGKAIRINEWSGGALTTSMVDDVFFILQKCGRRALATGSVQCVCAVLGQLNNLLAHNLRAALDAQWKPAATRLLQAVAAQCGEGAGASGDASQAAEQAAALNNADMSTSYVLKLRAELEEQAAALFGAPSDRERIKSVLADLAKTSSDFKHIAGKALDHLSSGIVPRLRPAFDEAAAASYELGDAEYAANEVEATWVTGLLGTLVACLQWLQPMLTPGNFDVLVASLLNKVVDRVEAVMRLKRFSQLGGLQLERDVRLLVSVLGEATGRPVRDKFARLAQMGTLLGLESVAELLEFWRDHAGGAGWRLGEEQVREVLGQRPDFSPQDIHALNLSL
ncbi:hypothetical protein WJX81_007056 [Elliptochloris bilobata]|uniref:Conserved oligomeric Golgi complex subunit 4 n=1 Tax=Elliptochloris bilobata TaxID=381761 RepID=A0AAW1QDM0_9CHLO